MATPQITEVTKHFTGTMEFIVEYENGVRFYTDLTDELNAFMNQAKRINRVDFPSGNFKVIYS